MRMRKKPNLEPRLDRVSGLLTGNPEAYKGRWMVEFQGYNEIYVELGCGKGRFTCEMAAMYPGALFIGVEREPNALLLSLERAKNEQLKNIRFISKDVRLLTEFFAPNEVSRIYINFCDPWPGNRHVKRRLTSDDFLALYGAVLSKGGDIRLKTDNVELFEYSLKRFVVCGFELSEVTRDLHGVTAPLVSPNDGEKAVMTNYEEKFHSLGVAINRCIAVKANLEPGSSSGAFTEDL